MAMYSDNVTVISAVTGSTTSDAIDISMREQVSFQIVATVTTGNGTLTVDVSNDKTNWITGIAFQDPTSTASTTWITSQNVTSTGAKGGFIPLAPWRYIRYVINVGGNGTYTVIHEAEG